MKVCLINNLYKPYAKGGAEVYVEKLFSGFLKRGDDVFVISTKPRGSNANEESSNYYLNSLYYNLSNVPRFLRIFWHFFNLFNFVNYLKINKIIKKEKPDLVITNNLLGLSLLLPLLFRRLKIKHLHILHDIQLLHPSGLMYLGKEDVLETFVAKIYQKINRYLFADLKYIIAPSRWIIDIHRKKGFFEDAKTNKLFNPIEEFPIKRDKIDHDPYDLLYVGQIEEHKGVVEAFEVVSALMKENQSINFSVIGSGSLLDEMKKKYNKSRIKFLGKLKREEVSSHMSRSDCLLVPSLCYENSPTVIYEAGILGLRFVYSDFGGISEIGKYFGGVPFDPRENESLKKSILKIISSKNIENKNKTLELTTSVYIEKMLLFVDII